MPFGVAFDSVKMHIFAGMRDPMYNYKLRYRMRPSKTSIKGLASL